MPDIFVAEKKTKHSAKNISDNPQELSDAFGGTLSNSSGTVHLFTSYCEDPDDVTFENQDEDEKVLLFIRKDLITNFPWVITGILLLIAPLFITVVLNLFKIQFLFIPQNYLLVTTSFYYLFIATFLFINFVTWYFNIDLVTNKRVIDVDFEGIVYKNVAATKISLVQDVSFTQVGVLRTIFDYGDVLVQTAGTIDNFIFEAVPNPEDAVHVVENLIGRKNE